MKRLMILTVAMSLACSAVLAAENAEKKKGPRDMPGVEQRMEMLTKQLDLNTDQQAKLKALFEQEAKDMREARSKMEEMTPEQRREKMRSRREALDPKIKEILTPEQYQKWQQHRQSRGQEGAPGKEKNGKGESKGQTKE